MNNNNKSPDVEYLKMIQSVITRQAGNSFTIKNWFITLFSGLLVIYFKSETITATAMFMLGAMIITTFYLLDVQYLWLERCFREKYKDVCNGKFRQQFDMEIWEYKSRHSICCHNKYGSFSFLIYFLAFIFLLICLWIKSDWKICELLCCGLN